MAGSFHHTFISIMIDLCLKYKNVGFGELKIIWASLIVFFDFVPAE
jgi:hypothetical protein